LKNWQCDTHSQLTRNLSPSMWTNPAPTEKEIIGIWGSGTTPRNKTKVLDSGNLSKNQMFYTGFKLYLCNITLFKNINSDCKNNKKQLNIGYVSGWLLQFAVIKFELNLFVVTFIAIQHFSVMIIHHFVDNLIWVIVINKVSSWQGLSRDWRCGFIIQSGLQFSK